MQSYRGTRRGCTQQAGAARVGGRRGHEPHNSEDSDGALGHGGLAAPCGGPRLGRGMSWSTEEMALGGEHGAWGDPAHLCVVRGATPCSSMNQDQVGVNGDRMGGTAGESWVGSAWGSWHYHHCPTGGTQSSGVPQDIFPFPRPGTGAGAIQCPPPSPCSCSGCCSPGAPGHPQDTHWPLGHSLQNIPHLP